MAKAKKAKKKRFAVLPDGARHEITGENGRYWVCGNRQFRKAAAAVEIEKEDAPTDGGKPEE